MIPDAPERLLRVVESQTVDESRRDDDLVKTEIELARHGQATAITLAVICILASIVFFALGKTLAGGILLGYPAIQLIRSFIPEGSSRRRRQSDDD